VLEVAERTQAGEEHDHGDGTLSPVSSSSGALTHKFDGAHLFAGHEGAMFPAKQQPRGAQRKELEELQARLDASEALARQREAELEDARAAAEAELEDARTADDARAALESELELEHAALEEERKRTAELEGRLAFLELEVESSSARGSDTAVRLEERVRALERELADVAAEAERVRAEAEVEAEAWAAERAHFQQEETQLAEGIESERARWEQEREELTAQAKDQVAAAADGLRALVQRFDVPLFSRESGLAVLVDALRRHLEKQAQNAEESELLLAAEVEKRAALSNELETAKGEIQALQSRTPISVSVLHSLRSQRDVQTIVPSHAEQPSFLDSHRRGTAAHLRARLRQRCHRLRGDPPASLGDTPVSRSARRTAQRRNPAFPCRQRAYVAQYACGRTRQPRSKRGVNQRYGRTCAQGPLQQRHNVQPWPRYTGLIAALATARRNGRIQRRGVRAARAGTHCG
jgi:hypothetical protein